MKVRLIVLLFIFFLSAIPSGIAHAQDAAPRFFSALPDIPLMPGLEEQAEQTVAFDTPEGRIVEAVASADSLQTDMIAHFYLETLPQLGWRPAGPLFFVRENEILKMVFEKEGRREFLRLNVNPKTSNP